VPSLLLVGEVNESSGVRPADVSLSELRDGQLHQTSEKRPLTNSLLLAYEELSEALRNRPELLKVVELAIIHKQWKMIHQIGHQFVPGWDDRYE
jgi:hypothetical protein